MINQIIVLIKIYIFFIYCYIVRKSFKKEKKERCEMKKSTFKKIIPIFCVVAVALCSCGSSKKKEELPKVEAAETVYGIEWGSSMEEVKGKMAEEGLEEKSMPESVADTVCAYIVNDYNGTKGANGKIMYMFDEKGKLTTISVKLSEDDGTDAKLVDNLKKSYDKAFNEILFKRKDFSDSNSTSDYLIYWLGMDSIVSISGDNGKSLSISYTDKASEPELVAGLEKN